MVDLARLKTCENSAELGYPGLAEVYVRATGDLEGRFTKPIPKVLCASWGKVLQVTSCSWQMLYMFSNSERQGRGSRNLWRNRMSQWCQCFTLRMLFTQGFAQRVRSFRDLFAHQLCPGVVEVNGTKRLKLGRKLSGDLWDLSRYWLLMEEVRRSLVGLMEHPIPLAQAMGSSMFFMYGANRALRRCCLLEPAAMASF